MILTIDAPHFYCGVQLFNGVVTCAAPIVSYMKGWTEERVRAYAEKKGWTVA